MGTLYEDYAAGVTRRVIALLKGVLADPGVPVETRYGEALTALAVNRRSWCLAPTWGIPPSKRIVGPASQPQRAARRQAAGVSSHLSRAGTSLAGVMWNFACHPVTLADRRASRPAYPRRHTKRTCAAAGADPGGVPAGFRRRPAAEPHPAAAAVAFYLLHRMVNGPVFGPFTPSARSRWIASLTGAALAATSENTRPCEVSRIQVAHANRGRCSSCWRVLPTIGSCTSTW